MTEIIQLHDCRPPVWYDVAVRHAWDGVITVWVRGTDIDDHENRVKVATALRQAADQLES